MCFLIDNQRSPAVNLKATVAAEEDRRTPARIKNPEVSESIKREETKGDRGTGEIRSVDKRGKRKDKNQRSLRTHREKRKKKNQKATEDSI